MNNTKRVEGVFTTQYGPCRFSMERPDSAVIFLGNEDDRTIVCYGVHYHGQLNVRKAEKAGWSEYTANTSINRVDKKDIRATDTYFNMKALIVGDFVRYIEHSANVGVLLMAKHVLVENERQALIDGIAAADNAIREARNKFHTWELDHARERVSLIERVTKLTSEEYDVRNVVIK